MKVYFSALIDKSVPLENSKLSKTLEADLRKVLRAGKSGVTAKEHNAFLFFAAEKSMDKSVDPKKMEEAWARLRLHFERYCKENKSRLEKEFKGSRELKETSQIVRTFLKEIDPNLPRVFDLRLKKLVFQLPNEFYRLQVKSSTAIWNLSEEQKVNLFLSGCTNQTFNELSIPQDFQLEAMVDKVAFLNFFCIFVEPTLVRLREMNKVLETLKLGLQGVHYRSSDAGTQSKLEMFLRILSAKLSSLQNMDKTIFSILKLFDVPEAFFTENGFGKLDSYLRSFVGDVSAKISQGRDLLVEVQEKLEGCLASLKDYLDESKNGVKIVRSKDEFKLVMFNLSELSSDLFVEAELLKLWLDFFSSDIPFFTFQSVLFNLQTPTALENSSGDCIISVRGLVKNYSLGETTVYAVRGVDLDVRDGEFLAIVGNSGAGKTTLLNCMAGLDEPDYGVVFFKGKDLHRLGDAEKSRARLLDMGFIFQNYALLPHFDTRENVALPADLAGLSKDLKNRIEELLEGVGINKQAKQFPSQLSGGQLQRVAIARALTNRPKVLFADEPTGDLDSKTGKQVMELIKKFHEETKTTIIVITHEQDIAGYAERQVRIEDGVMEE
jgi:putative ABC transport system ATP-binding protein